VKVTPYEIPSLSAYPALLAELFRVEDSLARLDERVRSWPLRDGWMGRLLYGEACACRYAAGELVHREELVLLDGGVFQGAMSPDLSSAWHVLGVWRKALKGNPKDLLGLARPGEEALRADHAGDVPEFFYDPDWNEPDRLLAWRRTLSQSVSLPPVAAAAVVGDAWLELVPDQHGAWRAPLLAALVLRLRGKTRSMLLPIDTGRRHVRSLAGNVHTQEARVGQWIDWIGSAVERADKDRSALVLAEEQLRLKCRGLRDNARLPDLVDLFLSRPLVTVPLAAKALRCSTQAVEGMMAQLGSIPREVTGRRRYRAWAV